MAQFELQRESASPYTLPNPLLEATPESSRRLTPVLVVSPHPDDAESGAGGTIAWWTAQGRKVVLVVVTNGDKYHFTSLVLSIRLSHTMN